MRPLFRSAYRKFPFVHRKQDSWIGPGTHLDERGSEKVLIKNSISHLSNLSPVGSLDYGDKELHG